MQLQKFIAALLIIVTIFTHPGTAGATEEENFHNWLIQFNEEAAGQINSKTLYNFIKSAEFLPQVIELDRKQPDKTKSFSKYLSDSVSKKRIKISKEKYHENKTLLDKIGRKYGVQPRFIVALWGSESDFGRNMGNFNILNSLATLGFEGRRADFFKLELLNALKMIDSQNIDPAQMQGSWAGAMGQTQFMPSSFLEFAVDYDQDGKKDIWHSKADVFASIANYLSKSGWDKNSTWGREIKLPQSFDESLIGRDIEKPLEEWHKLGIKTINGKNLPTKKLLMASVIKVENQKDSRVFLIYPNYKLLLKWNRSLYFASAISLLADKIN